MLPPMVTVGSPLRWSLGIILLALAGVVILATHDLEFGIGWTAVIPALLLGVPGASLLRRRVLSRDGGVLSITEGWLWRRCRCVPLEGARLVAVPTAGLLAVVLWRDGRETALATWVRRPTALAIADLTGLPLEDAPRPETDR